MSDDEAPRVETLDAPDKPGHDELTRRSRPKECRLVSHDQNLCLIAILSMGVTLAACANDRVWMRSGASSSDADVDEVSCAEEAEKSGVSVSIGGEASPPMDRFSQRYACLRARGYKLVTLDAEEAARMKSLGGAEREDYWRVLLTKRGFAPAQPPRPLPPAPTQ